MNYRNYIRNLPTELLDVHGEGVNIGIFDSGINNHPDLHEAITGNQNFTNSPHGFNDDWGHGTHIAGLIGARGNADTGLIGIADHSSLTNLKVANDNGSTSATNLNNALRYVINNNHIDILNLSMNINNLRYNIIHDNLTNVLNSQRIVVAAAGNNDELSQNSELLCPANIQGVIAVGAIRREFIISNPNFRFNAKLDFLLLEENLLSCDKASSNYISMSGCSQSAALLSGIIALIKNIYPNYDYLHIKNYISNFAVKYGSDNSINSFNIIKP